jgi:glycosyltransferase involved in cell wall biosynthesis
MSGPRVLILHNRYRQPGGEDVLVQAQARLLRDRGHEVRLLEKDNREIDAYGFFRKAALFFSMADNVSAAQEVAKIAREFKPDVALVHNTLPLLSPSVYAPLRKAGVKIIQALQNFRLLCPAGTLYRDGTPCTLCVDDNLKHAVTYRCWTGSQMATLGLTRMLDRHRRMETWSRMIDLFVAANPLQRDLLVQKKLVPPEKIVVQPNFVHAEISAKASDATAGNGFIFVGRLTPEKGIRTLLNAAQSLPGIALSIAGDGPLRGEVEQACAQLSNCRYLGQLARADVLAKVGAARALVFPSEWQEGSPFTVIEAMAAGCAVIASRIAGVAELVKEGETGLQFNAGKPDELAACVRQLEENAELARKLGRSGRERYERELSPEAGYRRMKENFEKLGIF